MDINDLLKKWSKQAGSILITGATGCGKSFIASALGDRACRQGYGVIYFGMQKLLSKLKIVRLEGVVVHFFEKLAKTDLLIIDDFEIETMDKEQQPISKISTAEDLDNLITLGFRNEALLTLSLRNL